MSEYEGLKRWLSNYLGAHFPLGRAHPSTVEDLLRRSLDAIRTLEERVAGLRYELDKAKAELRRIEDVQTTAAALFVAMEEGTDV